MKKEFKKKLCLNKRSVARLNRDELSGLKGGNYTDRAGCPPPDTYGCQSEYCSYNCWTEDICGSQWLCT